MTGTLIRQLRQKPTATDRLDREYEAAGGVVDVDGLARAMLPAYLRIVASSVDSARESK